MKSLAIFIILVFFLLGCSTPIKTTESSGPRVHNLAPDFITYWNEVKARPSTDQIRSLKSEYLSKFPEFYNYKIQKWEKSGKQSDQELARHLKEFPLIETEFKKKTNEISSNLDLTMTSFVKVFPDLNKDFDVYIIHSFGEMDGGTRRIEDKTSLILGIDGMVKFHKNFSSEMPFFHHELFHVYHSHYLPERNILWSALWAEGLAIYASEQLNSQAPQRDLLLDIPEGMVGKIEKDLDYHLMDLSIKLMSENEVDYQTYFLMSSKDRRIVKRSGYYLGYLIAKEIGKTKTVSEMARMKAGEALALIKSTIQMLQENSVR